METHDRPRKIGGIHSRRLELEGTRSLYLIDIENLCGGKFWFARRVLGFFLLQSGWTNGEISVLACNHGLVAELAWEIQAMQCRLHARSGRDGADLALLEAAPASWVVDRFDRLVIGSGDGIFAPLARRVSDAGVRVEVVGCTHGVSHKLAAVADDTIPIAWRWKDYRQWRAGRRELELGHGAAA